MITYVTGNRGKYLNVKRNFESYNIDIDFCMVDLDEPDVNDIEFISKEKVLSAYKIVNGPCFVIDSGFYIDNYPGNPGYPGAFVKRSGISSNIDLLLKKMENVNDRSCKFVDCLTYYDGKDIYQFFGESKGTLSLEKRGDVKEDSLSNLWYVFIPDNHNKTLAEMSLDERLNRKDNHISSVTVFIEWYNNQKRKRLL